MTEHCAVTQVGAPGDRLPSPAGAGAGVGWCKATSGTTRGVYGRSDSPEGYGVYGFAFSLLSGER